jgi:glycosyltransferase involved in cell wall biosynthesis
VRRVRAVRPQIVHTHLVHADLFGQLAAASARTPVRVSTKHGFNEFRDSRVFSLADRLSVAATDAHIAISRGLAAYLAEVEGFAEERFTIIHYGIDAGAAPPAPYPDGPPRLLCIGRLIPIKGHEILLRAFAAALRERDELMLELAGSGPLEPELRAQTQALGIEDSVAFLGHVTPVQPLLERAAAVVVPSLGEGFGMVALEAMERERPVVASAVGGLPEIVRDGETGLVVPPGDADALAQALLGVIGDRERAESFGRAGRARALEHFSQVRCTERTLLVYDELLARHLDHARSTAIAASSASTKSHGTR